MERKKTESEAAEKWGRDQLREVERAHGPCQQIITELRTQLAELRVRAECCETSLRQGKSTYACAWMYVRRYIYYVLLSPQMYMYVYIYTHTQHTHMLNDKKLKYKKGFDENIHRFNDEKYLFLL